MRILITGGAGFVGSSLAHRFRREYENADVIAFDNLKRRGSELNLPLFYAAGIHFVQGDVRISSDLESLPGEFDLLIDASAEPSVQAGMDGSPNYVFETNLGGTFNCLTFARKRVGKFVLLSSSRVYSIQPLRAVELLENPVRFDISDRQTLSGISPEGISEDFPTALPRSIYGTTKLCAEYLLQEFAYSYGLASVIYRCGVIAGPGQFGKVDQGVITLWVANHYFKKPLQYLGFRGSGKQVRDVLHIEDLCDAVLLALKNTEKVEGVAFNVGGGKDRSVSLLELTSLCERIVGSKVSISTAEHTSPMDVPVYISDCRRIASVLGWAPARNMESIIYDVLNWIRRNETQLKPIFL